MIEHGHEPRFLLRATPRIIFINDSLAFVLWNVSPRHHGLGGFVARTFKISRERFLSGLSLNRFEAVVVELTSLQSSLSQLPADPSRGVRQRRRHLEYLTLRVRRNQVSRFHAEPECLADIDFCLSFTWRTADATIRTMELDRLNDREK